MFPQKGREHACWHAGLKNLLSLTASRKLSERASASLGATWVAGAGLSMRFATQRRLGARTEASFSWALGAAGEGGVALNVAHRREHFLFSAKLEVSSHILAHMRICRALTWTCIAGPSQRKAS